MNKLKIIGAGAAAGFSLCLMFVAGWEGKRLEAYPDIVGVPTICFGHTAGVEIGDTATDAECRAQLNAELQVYWDRVDDYVTQPMLPREHVAFTSLAYNIGLQAFAKSTLLKHANKPGMMAFACFEILRWDRAGGKVVKGLQKRRQAEFNICIGQGVE